MGFQPVGTLYRFGLVSLHNHVMCVHAKSPQLCPTLCNPMDCSLPGSSVHGFPRQEYWNGLPFPSPGDLPDPGIEPASPMASALAGGFFTIESPGKPFSSLESQYSPWTIRMQFPVHFKDLLQRSITYHFCKCL